METIAEKLDLYKVDKTYYTANKTPVIIDLDSYFYVTIQGQSSPDNPKFLNAIQTLYATVYGIKFLSKEEDNDFVVPKMEGQWWISGDVRGMDDFLKAPREEWNWKIMVRMPDFIEGDHFHRIIESLKVRKPEYDNIDQMHFELINEGTCAQVLHVGSYDQEGPTLEKLHGFIEQEGMKIAGHHHEIYLKDPKRTEEEKLQTIIRYPITKKVKK